MKTISKPSLFNRNNQLDDITSKWELVDTLSGGTDAMRDAGRMYLKQNPKESIDKYRDRLSRATLTNKYSRTIDKAVGKAFARKMNIVLPTGLEQLVVNADGQGTSLESFSKKLLNDTINYGITYVLVDFPSSVGPTLADQRTTNAFPYFVEINPTQLLDLKADYINNKIQLTYFRFYEALTEYGELVTDSIAVEQVKEFILNDDMSVTYNVYRKDNTKNKTDVLVETGTLSVQGIPIIPIYGKKTTAFMGQPVLMDLAHLNIKHWWKQSDLDWNEHYGLTPILGIAGADLGTTDAETGKSGIEDFTISASTVVNLGENGSLSWTKADATGIAAAQASLDRLLEEMDDAGLELTTKQTGSAETATGRMLDSAEANSILKSIVVDLNWQLYQAVLIAGDYMGIAATDADISIDTTYTTASQTNTNDLTVLLQLFEANVITIDELRLELQARKLFVSESVDEGLNKVPPKLEADINKPVVVNPLQDNLAQPVK